MKKLLFYLLILAFLNSCENNYRKENAIVILKKENPEAAKILWLKTEGKFGPDIYLIVDSNYKVKSVEFIPQGSETKWLKEN